MVLKKTYKRYSLQSAFGVIGSNRCNTVLIEKLYGKGVSDSGHYVAVGANENVVVWDTRKGEKVMVLKGDKHEVTCITKGPNNKYLAVGYNDGSIKLWDLKEGSDQVTFSGHKSAITSLCFDSLGSRLASGSRDTDVIVWDVLNEQGIFRLKGHKGPVTRCQFLKHKNILITSSKDTFVKFWDLDTQHCFLTLVGHRSEVWGFVIAQDEKRLVTGSSDSELKVWSINYVDEDLEEDGQREGNKRKAPRSAINGNDSSEEEEQKGPITCAFIGSLMRQSTDRVAALVVDSTERYLACHGTDSVLEVYKICNQEEISKTLKKRLKKLNKKQREKPEAEQVNNEEITVLQTVEDEFCKVQAFKMKSKLRSCDIHLESSGELKVVLLHNNNSLSICRLSVNQSQPECSNIALLTQAGHRSDTRTLAFSSDATCILSGSGESVKIWNRFTQKCIRTLESDYALSSIFVPGDRHVIVGTKTGKLQLYDISAGVLLEVIDSHEDSVWGLAISPDQKGFVSGSADHDVKFWEFELIDDPAFSSSSKRLSMAHVRTLKMQDDVLGVKYSPDQRLLAVSLLDSTVKVFFSDTLKFFLSLYGHKLPVLCMDISLDSTLLITGSADKNIKIWGLDFGDCHKSIFAHDDSIMDVKFVSKTHYFFSVSKDKTLKYWDADKYENIMTLQGHQAEIWCMAVSPNGEFVVTGSHDKSIRLWERTEELLVIDEEREQEREEAYEETLAEGGEPIIPGETDGEAGFAGKKTLETMKGAEKIMEAMELCKEEEEKLAEHQVTCQASGKKVAPPPIHPILAAYDNVTPLRYVLDVLKKIRSSELEESLLVLPFSYVIDLLKLINRWIENSWEIELASRCQFFLLRIHHNQIVSNQVLLDTMEALRKNTKDKISEMKDQIGFNLAGLQFIQREMEAKSIVFFADATEKVKKKKKKKAMLVLR